MTTADTLLVVVILIFLGLIVWSRIMRQTMLETVRELKQMMLDLKEGKE